MIARSWWRHFLWNILQNIFAKICKFAKFSSLPNFAKMRAVVWYVWSHSYSLTLPKGHPGWPWGWLVWPQNWLEFSEWRLRDDEIQLSDDFGKLQFQPNSVKPIYRCNSNEYRLVSYHYQYWIGCLCREQGCIMHFEHTNIDDFGVFV